MIESAPSPTRQEAPTAHGLLQVRRHNIVSQDPQYSRLVGKNDWPRYVEDEPCRPTHASHSFAAHPPGSGAACAQFSFCLRGALPTKLRKLLAGSYVISGSAPGAVGVAGQPRRALERIIHKLPSLCPLQFPFPCQPLGFCYLPGCDLFREFIP